MDQPIVASFDDNDGVPEDPKTAISSFNPFLDRSL